MSSFFRHLLAYFLTLGTIVLTPLWNWPLGATNEFDYWFRIIVGIVAMLSIAGVMFKFVAGTSFKLGVGEWIVINLALAGLLAVVFPDIFDMAFSTSH